MVAAAKQQQEQEQQQRHRARRLPSAVKRCAKASARSRAPARRTARPLCAHQTLRRSSLRGAQLLDELEQVIAGLRTHLDALARASHGALHGATIALAFGSAPARPREVYRLHLHLSPPPSSSASDPPSSHDQLQQHFKASLRRQLVRGLLQQHETLPGWERQLPGTCCAAPLLTLASNPPRQQRPPTRLSCCASSS